VQTGQTTQKKCDDVSNVDKSDSITAELLAGARALSLADRHHFKLNLSDLLDKLTQHKRNWLLNVVAARQRLERQLNKSTLKASKLSPKPIPN